MGDELRKPAKRVTIYSIAEELGIHASTVSRALSKPEMVRAELRDQILQKAAELKFELNPVARGLTTGRTGTLGLLIPDIANPYFVPLVRSIQHAAAGAGLATMLMDSQLDESAELGLVSQARGRVDGLILVSPRHSVAELVEAADGRDVVLVNRRLESIPSVMVDMSAALRAAGEHLEHLGHSRIAILRGPEASWVSGHRTGAVQDWADTRPVELVEVGPVEASFEGGRDGATSVLQSDVTAVIAFDDLTACGLVSGLVAAGASVPADISIVGIDDVLLASVITPRLTTVRVPYEELGAQAISLMTDQLQDTGEPREITLEGELVIRESTVPPV